VYTGEGLDIYAKFAWANIFCHNIMAQFYLLICIMPCKCKSNYVN
jgi:hypothetical protein